MGTTSKSNLLQQQHKFTRMLVQLLTKAHSLGYEITLGDAYRDSRLFGAFGERKGYGESKSFHKLRLAIDLNLFKDNKYLPDTSSHEELGKYWESLGGTWGGRFSVADGNHYSLGE